MRTILRTSITVGAGASDVVTLRGLEINGNGSGLQGINFTAGAALHVHNVGIRNFRNANPFTAGILFQRTGSGYGELYVSDSYITDNGGAGASSGGIVIFFQDTSSANAVIDGVRIANNFGSGVRSSGVAASGKGSSLIRIGNSTIANNVTGVSAVGAGVVESFKDNQIAGNSTDGTPITAVPGPGGTPLQ